MGSLSHNLQQIEGEDMLSALPDHVLLSILDRVDICTAARASVLSRRWRHLPPLLSNLDIDVDAFRRHPCNDWTLDNMHAAMTTVTKVTESFLAAPASERTIKSLLLEFYLIEKYTSDIGKLLGEAIDSGKVTGCVELVTVANVRECISSARHGCRLMQFARASPNVFGRLNKLCLQFLRFDGSGDIASLLSSCRHLEVLRMYGCDCGEWKVLQINAPDSQLKELLVNKCGFKRIELLHVPKLARLTCSYWISSAAPLSLGCVPCLQQLNIGNVSHRWQVKFKLSELLCNAAHIEHLSLDFCSYKIWIRLEDPKQLAAAFSKLKILVLKDVPYECDLLWTMLLLRAAPVLETFQIQVYKHVGETNMDVEKHITASVRLSAFLEQKAFDFKHYCLKQLKITGFKAEDKQINFIRLILEQAVILKNVILTDGSKLQTSSSAMSTFPENEDEKDLIVKQIKEGISSPAHVVIRKS